MTIYSVFAAFVVFALTSSAPLAQTMSADEKAIRDLIAAGDSGKPLPQTEDSIFWTGAFKRPVIGREKPVPIPSVENRVGPAKVKRTVRRIEVSQSGDMAYEFSDGEVTTQVKGQDGKIEASTWNNSLLRVWKKVTGQWQVAAHFARPHEE